MKYTGFIILFILFSCSAGSEKDRLDHSSPSALIKDVMPYINEKNLEYVYESANQQDKALLWLSVRSAIYTVQQNQLLGKLGPSDKLLKDLFDKHKVDLKIRENLDLTIAAIQEGDDPSFIKILKIEDKHGYVRTKAKLLGEIHQLFRSKTIDDQYIKSRGTDDPAFIGFSFIAYFYGIYMLGVYNENSDIVDSREYNNYACIKLKGKKSFIQFDKVKGDWYINYTDGKTCN